MRPCPRLPPNANHPAGQGSASASRLSVQVFGVCLAPLQRPHCFRGAPGLGGQIVWGPADAGAQLGLALGDCALVFQLYGGSVLTDRGGTLVGRPASLTRGFPCTGDYSARPARVADDLLGPVADPDEYGGVQHECPHY